MENLHGIKTVDRDFIQVEGEDAKSFLQSQCSQDIEKIDEKNLSLILNPNGKVVSLLRISKFKDGYLLDLDRGAFDVVNDRLKKFKIRVKVSIQKANFNVLRSSDLTLLMELRERLQLNEFLVVPFRWNEYEAFDLFFEGEIDSKFAEFSAFDRISIGFPRFGNEIDESTIAQEIPGLVENCVSFTKGCYTGQELVARVDSRGSNVRKLLTSFEVKKSLPYSVLPGSKIKLSDAKQFEITSFTATDDQGGIGMGFMPRGVNFHVLPEKLLINDEIEVFVKFSPFS